MQATLAPRSDAQLFLTHFVGRCLDDDRYVVQRYVSKADGQLVPVHADGAKPKGRGVIVTAKAGEKLRPARRGQAARLRTAVLGRSRTGGLARYYPRC